MWPIWVMLEAFFIFLMFLLAGTPSDNAPCSQWKDWPITAVPVRCVTNLNLQYGKVFADGMMFKLPRDGAPDFVKRLCIIQGCRVRSVSSEV
jgi:hypothetical protein